MNMPRCFLPATRIITPIVTALLLTGSRTRGSTLRWRKCTQQRFLPEIGNRTFQCAKIGLIHCIEHHLLTVVIRLLGSVVGVRVGIRALFRVFRPIWLCLFGHGEVNNNRKRYLTSEADSAGAVVRPVPSRLLLVYCQGST